MPSIDYGWLSRQESAASEQIELAVDAAGKACHVAASCHNVEATAEQDEGDGRWGLTADVVIRVGRVPCDFSNPVDGLANSLELLARELRAGRNF